MSRNVDIVGKLFPNKTDKDLFDTLFYSDDGLPLLKIVRKKDSGGNIYFEFEVDGANNNYATEDDVDEKIAALGRVLTYKGKVATIDDLPASGNNPGDVWYVEEASAEYVWIVDDNVGSWEELGPVISDVPHAKKADLADYADNLTPFSKDSGVTQSVPFINQGTGCANGTAQADTGSFMQFKEKRGNMAVVNQLIDSDNFDSAPAPSGGVTFTNNGDGTVTATVSEGGATDTVYYQILDLRYNPNIIAGRRYFCFGGKDETQVYINFGGGAICGEAKVYQAEVGFGRVRLTVASGTPAGTYIFKPLLSDLTKWFGSTDNIPADLLSHPENFFRYYQGDLSYNAGASVNSNARYLTNIGRNLWDEVVAMWGRSLAIATGESYSNPNAFVSSYIEVAPNTKYTKYNATGNSELYVCYYDKNKNYISGAGFNGPITTPANCIYMRFSIQQYGTVYNHDITISLYYPDESGYDQYYPYEVLTVVDTGSEDLGAFDVKYPNGLIERNTLNKTYNGGNDESWDLQGSSSSGVYSFRTQLTNVGGETRNIRAICDKLIWKGGSYSTETIDCIFTQLNASGIMLYVRIKEATTVEEFRTWLASNNLHIQIETNQPTTEQGTPFIDQDGNPIGEFIPCDDFGSMIVSADNFNGIPMGNEIFYPVNYKAYLDTLVNHTNGDPTSLVRKSDMSSNKMYMYSLYIDELSTNENEEISVYFNVISKDPNLFVAGSDTIDKENNFKTLCENYSGVYITASGNVAFDDSGENKTVSYIKVNKDPTIYRLSIRFNEGGYYNKTIINNQGAFVESAGLLSCGVKVEI